MKGYKCALISAAVYSVVSELFFAILRIASYVVLNRVKWQQGGKKRRLLSVLLEPDWLID